MRKRIGIQSTSRSTPTDGDSRASGWPNTITCQELLAPRPSVLIGHVAGKTSTIRVGSGGVMLPNHSPLVIAEQFGTLDALYPGRIDLGVGRATGSERLTSQALRFNATEGAFPQQVNELLAYPGPQTTGRQLTAYPGVESNVPVWLLGSSMWSASAAAQLGLPYAFAHFIDPAPARRAIEHYRSHFKPGNNSLSEPHTILATGAYHPGDRRALC